MRLTLRFYILVGALLAAVAASAASGYRALNSLDAALTRVVDSDMQRMLAITHARRLFRSMTVLERDHILARSPAEREGNVAKMAKLGDELVQHLDRYVELMPAGDAERIEKIRGVRARWLERDAAVLAAAVIDQDQALTLAKAHKQDPVSWEAEIGELVKLSESRLAAQVQQTHVEAMAARKTILVVSALAALVAAGLGTIILFAIRKNLAEVVRLNTGLEGIVAERTRELHERERSLKMVLDGTGDAFILIDLAGNILGESSQAAVRWFGQPRPGMNISEYLLPENEDARLQLEVAIGQLGEDMLPWEVSVEQLPKRLSRGDQTLELDVRQVFEADRFAKILVIARNVTERVRGEDAERSAREQQSVIAKLLADKAGFSQFVSDTEELLETLVEDKDEAILKRALHTLKGNVALFGMDSLAARCHAVEDAMASTGEPPRGEELHALVVAWRQRLKSIDGFLHAGRNGVFEVKTEEHTQLLRSITERLDYTELLAMVETWTWTQGADVLSRVRAQLEFLAKKLGKPVQVAIRDNGVRFPPGYLDRFWPTLVHVTRNAVDHGIEPEGERVELGKSPEAHLTLTLAQTQQGLLMEISDDGPGLDREALQRRAREKGISLAAGEPVEMLIFKDGLSTRHEASELSGRGVGLAATLEACRAAGGRVEVISAPHRGTTLRFRFPLPAAARSPSKPASGVRATVPPAKAG